MEGTTNGSGVVLTAGDDTAALDLETGGRLASLVAGGAERLVSRASAPPRDDVPSALMWGSYLMAPWVGRLDHGVLPWRGETYQMPPDNGPHAIHGTVYDRPWELVEHTGTSTTLRCALVDPWPFGGEVRQTVSLRPGALELTAQVVAGDRAMPAGLGWHPWFVRSPDPGFSVRLTATNVLEARDDLVPTGALAELDDVTDLNFAPPLGDRLLDHFYVGVTPPAEITWPDLVLRVHWEPPVNCVTVHSPPAGVVVEPQTVWPNGPRLAADGVEGTGLATLEPGEALTATTIWTWTPT